MEAVYAKYKQQKIVYAYSIANIRTQHPYPLDYGNKTKLL